MKDYDESVSLLQEKVPLAKALEVNYSTIG